MSETITATQSTQLVEQFNIAPTKADQIMGAFTETAQLIGELDKDFKKFSDVKEITDDVCEEAKDLRLKYVKARTGADKKRKEIKAQVLLESKAIDGAGNIFKLQISEREKSLQCIEEHFEKIEEAKRQKLKNERMEELKKFGIEEFDHLYLDQMTTEIWESYYAGEKAKFEAAQAQIKKDADEQKKLEKQKKLDDEKIRKDNARLVKEKESTEAKAKKDKEIADKKLAEAQKKIDEAKQAEIDRKAKEKAEQEKIEAKAKKDKEIDEKAMKNKKYLEWLKENNLDQSMVGVTKYCARDYEVERKENFFTLYKTISSITF